MKRLEAQVAGSGALGASLSGTPLAVLRLLRGAPSTIDDLRLILAVSRREVEEAVEELRLRGEPVIAGSDGLRLTEDPAELEKYVEARRRRLATIYLGSRALRRTARRMREATDLTLFGEIAA